MRLIEIRPLEGPNVYRLEPVVRLEVALGRRRAWRGVRDPGGRVAGGLRAAVPARAWPDEIAAVVAWVRRLRAESDERIVGLAVHRCPDPGHWVVTFPWGGRERASAIAASAFELAEQSVSPVRSARLTGTQTRLLARAAALIARSATTPPGWIRDDDRRIPVVSISGTNGKSTVSRLISHVLLLAGRRVGTTTSDGVLVDGRLVEAGDWTGPGGAARVLGRSDVDVAVLETARGGILFRGIGYESNEASVITNVSADHLDLQGIHTLPELAEVKATVCRMTRPDGWVVLNADDAYVSAMARRVRARVAYFSVAPRPPAVVRRHLAAGRRAYLLEGDRLVEAEGSRRETIAAVGDVPITLGGLARHNVANALAAAGGARALGATVAEVARGLREFRPDQALSPGRLNLFRLGDVVVVVDYAHNEAGLEAILDVAEGIASAWDVSAPGAVARGMPPTGAAGGRAVPITAIIGTAGDRPDESLEGIGRIAARRAQRVVIKETVGYLRGRSREAVVDRLLAGIEAGGGSRGGVPVHESEVTALRAELERPGERVIVLMCHAERDDVFRLLAASGARPVDVVTDRDGILGHQAQRERCNPDHA